MRHLLKLFGVISFLFCTIVNAADVQENKDIARLFNSAKVAGTFVLFDTTEEKFIVHDQARANKRFIPASTFKIPNSLIGLSVGAVESVDEILPYGGKPQPFKQWEKDMGLRDAIKVSNVPVYKELARRVGTKNMEHYVKRINFGNMKIGNTIDDFWLIGPLEISAMEQAEFLASLAQGTLPLANDVQEKVREIILLEKNTEWTLYGKTGWVNSSSQNVGWFVGWLVKDKKIYSFALNIDINIEADIDKRIPLVKDCLKIINVI